MLGGRTAVFGEALGSAAVARGHFGHDVRWMSCGVEVDDGALGVSRGLSSRLLIVSAGLATLNECFYFHRQLKFPRQTDYSASVRK
jgi:hypothetical protein